MDRLREVGELRNGTLHNDLMFGERYSYTALHSTCNSQVVSPKRSLIVGLGESSSYATMVDIASSVSC
jgi:hypothetical protein